MLLLLTERVDRRLTGDDIVRCCYEGVGGTRATLEADEIEGKRALRVSARGTLRVIDQSAKLPAGLPADGQVVAGQINEFTTTTPIRKLHPTLCRHRHSSP